MKKKNNRKNYILVLVAVLLFAAVGYSIFTDVLNISGTANTTGNFSLEFSAATIASQTKSSNATATISTDKKTLTLTAPDLQSPGAKVVYNVTITNVGSLDAVLKTVNITGNTDPDIKVTTTPVFVENSTVLSGANYQFAINVEWDAASTTGNKDLTYTVTLNYEQAP